jgi:very-short-patch-repair endonuclease
MHDRSAKLRNMKNEAQEIRDDIRRLRALEDMELWLMEELPASPWKASRQSRIIRLRGEIAAQEQRLTIILNTQEHAEEEQGD